MTMIYRGLIIALCLGSLAACSGMNDTQQRALSGGAIGAGVGAVGAAILGGPLLVGAGLGAAGGAVVGAATSH